MLNAMDEGYRRLIHKALAHRGIGQTQARNERATRELPDPDLQRGGVGHPPPWSVPGDRSGDDRTQAGASEMPL